MIQQTSLKAFFEINSELGQRQLQVYRVLAKIQPATNLMISEASMIPINNKHQIVCSTEPKCIYPSTELIIVQNPTNHTVPSSPRYA